MKKDGKAIDWIDQDILMDSLNISISYQVLGMQPTNSNDDPTLKFDWSTYPIKEHTVTASGHIIQPISPSTSNPKSLKNLYPFDSCMPVALAASMFEFLRTVDLKSVPKLDISDEFPYQE